MTTTPPTPTTTTAEELAADAVEPSVRLLDVERQGSAPLGFHLTRTRWDPYPWVRSVDEGSAAHNAGIRAGDCLLEVNGDDVLGRSIGAVADLVRAGPETVSLLVWNAGSGASCAPEALCCGPMPANFEKLSGWLGAVLAALECPICLELVGSPARQCPNGHLACARCVARSPSSRCAVCRAPAGAARSLFAERALGALSDAFGLSSEPEGERAKAVRSMFKMRQQQQHQQQEELLRKTHANKFLERLRGKSSSVENLSTAPPAGLERQQPFDAGLRTKSSSSCEISRTTLSPCVSRSTSAQRIGLEGLATTRRKSLSFNGSLSAPFGAHFEEVEETLVHCPFEPDCDEGRVEGSGLLKHFQSAHEGPLLQYFRPRMSIRLDELRNERLCVINDKDNVLFVKSRRFDRNESGSSEGDVFVWVWLVDSPSPPVAANGQFRAHLRSTHDPTRIWLSVTSPLCALSVDSWGTILAQRKGVYISAETLQALCSGDEAAATLDLQICLDR